MSVPGQPRQSDAREAPAARGEMPRVLSPRRRPGLPPPRFGLKTLLVGMACLCGLLSVYQAAGAIAGWGVTLAAAIVLAHLAGNTLGTRLRDHADRERAVSPTQLPEARGIETADPPRIEFAPVTSLSQRRPPGWPVRLGTALGALAGGWLAFTWLLDPSHSGPGDVIVGVAALGVMGGIASFGLATLLRVGLSAWCQAQATAHRAAKRAPQQPWPGTVGRWIGRLVAFPRWLPRQRRPRG